jgi:hypothetical protein
MPSGLSSGAEMTSQLSRLTDVKNTGRPAPNTLSAAQTDRAERALTRHIGPIAKLVVRRTVSEVQSETALWERLATYIDVPADRALFLSQRLKG